MRSTARMWSIFESWTSAGRGGPRAGVLAPRAPADRRRRGRHAGAKLRPRRDQRRRQSHFMGLERPSAPQGHGVRSRRPAAEEPAVVGVRPAGGPMRVIGMLKISAGILLFRKRPAGVEVMLVHPGGPF